MNNLKEDVGVLKDYNFDLEYGNDQNNFECTVNLNNHVCESGYYLYFENKEYGGIIDSIAVDTNNKEVKYVGRTWHGIIDSKILQPDENQDYLIVSGEANEVLNFLISRMGLDSLFVASSDDSGINISNYQIERYISGYEAIKKMLKSVNAKLIINFKNGFVELSASPLVNYAQDEQFDTDQIDFSIQKNFNPLNHVICLGQGELKDRQVIHLYTDSKGNLSNTQILIGIDEVVDIYDFPNAESIDELKQGGIDMLIEAWNSDEIEFEFNSNDKTYDIGDIVGAVEKVTGIEVSSDIKSKIVTIKNNTTTISYKVGD